MSRRKRDAAGGASSGTNYMLGFLCIRIKRSTTWQCCVGFRLPPSYLFSWVKWCKNRCERLRLMHEGKHETTKRIGCPYRFA